MAIKTTTFGGITLSGKDAEAFEHQVTYGRPSKAARESFARGKIIVKEYERKGYATIRTRKDS